MNTTATKPRDFEFHERDNSDEEAEEWSPFFRGARFLPF